MFFYFEGGGLLPVLEGNFRIFIKFLYTKQIP